MKVRVIQEFETTRGALPVGQIIEVSAALLEKLKGKVEVVDASTFRGAVEIITPEGDSVWVATEPEAVSLIPEGTAYFTAPEIMQLQQAGRQAARVALMVKQVFPGAGPVKIEANREDVH